MKRCILVGLPLAFVFLVSCEKEADVGREENQILSSAVSSDAFLSLSASASQQDVISRLKSDPDAKNFVSRVERIYRVASWIVDTMRRNLVVQAQLRESIEPLKSRWSSYLGKRADKDAIIRAGIQGAFPSLPRPASNEGPCEEKRNQDERRCHLAMAVDAALCSFAWAAGPYGYGACLVGVGAKGFLCIYDAGVAYNACKSTRAYIAGYRLYDWIWTSAGWRYSPISKKPLLPLR